MKPAKLNYFEINFSEKASYLNLFQVADFKVFAGAELDGVFKQVTLQRVEVFNLKIAIGKNAFYFKLVRFAKVFEAVFFANTQHIE